MDIQPVFPLVSAAVTMCLVPEMFKVCWYQMLLFSHRSCSWFNRAFRPPTTSFLLSLNFFWLDLEPVHSLAKFCFFNSLLQQFVNIRGFGMWSSCTVLPPSTKFVHSDFAFVFVERISSQTGIDTKALCSFGTLF